MAAVSAGPASVEEFARVVEELVGRPGVSAARARQLRWVAGELRRAGRREEFPAAARGSLAALLGQEAVGAYLALAGRGELRTREVPDPKRVSDASMRVRVDCLELVARAAGLPPPEPPRPAPPQPKPTVGARQRSLLRRHLADRAGHEGADAGRVRLLALIGVVLDTGARVGELCALRLDDLPGDLATVRVVRRPQARSVSPPVAEVLPLSGSTRTALRHWLAVREELVEAVRGGRTALWVSVRSNHAGVVGEDGRVLRRPPGMPLMPRGLARAYTRAVVRLNAEMAGRPGWEPLPYRLEQLRRAVCEELQAGADGDPR
ncbi:tyrosine-type recombinase/integrase [Streptomyces capparidis]